MTLSNCSTRQPFVQRQFCLFVYKPQESAAESARVLLESSAESVCQDFELRIIPRIIVSGLSLICSIVIFAATVYHTDFSVHFYIVCCQDFELQYP